MIMMNNIIICIIIAIFSICSIRAQTYQARNFTYLGCYNDRKDLRDVYEKDYTRVTKLNNSYAIVEICVRLCAMADYKYAAIQSYDECYCGNTYGRYNKTNELNCFFKCSGYPCGGYDTNSIYSTANANLNFNVNDISSPATTNSIQKPNFNNPCEANPCKNSGVCISILDGRGKFKSFICQCKNPEHIGPLCEQTNYCYSNPCLHGGSCISVVNGFQCICTTNWYGANCEYQNIPITKAIVYENPHICTDNERSMCKNGGTCIKVSRTIFKCVCQQNYTGDYCEIFDICSMNPCKNNGLCTFNAPSSFTCNCTSRYFGTFCELENPCFINNANPCLNGGVCRNQIVADAKSDLNIKTNLSYICLCYGNFMGKNCDICKTGYQGEKCDNVINYCNPSPCIQGFCQWQLGSYQCNCYEGWQGRNCDSQSCRYRPCLNGGTCSGLMNNITNSIDYLCMCPPGYSGLNCEKSACLPNPCLANENCIILGYDSTYRCEPIPLTTMHIDMINLCDIKPNICPENSYCTFNQSDNGYYCKCIDNSLLNIQSCNFQINYRDFFENDTTTAITPILTTNPLTTAETSLQTDQQERAGLAEPKNNLKLFTATFNSENLYWIVPLALVIVLIFMFIAIAAIFGYKARNRGTPHYTKNELCSKSRSIKFYDDGSTENQFKSISTITVPNIKCSNTVDSTSDNMQKYLDSYGRVV